MSKITPPHDENLTKREDVKAILWLLLYSFVLLFFLSPDSYIRDTYYYFIDSTCFFMCGKAWMCGMVPYVDFADSKGPLLWLIYGVGYLISHHSYIGVFWISILFYTATLFTAYKLCRLFADKKVSAVSVTVLPLFLLLFLIHKEMKAEDFCYTFVMLSLYCSCRILRYRDSDANTYFKLSALMGVCSMCCVLIKYNIGCMIMGLMAVVLYMAIRHKAGWQSFWGMAIGFVAPAVPFVFYFLIQGNFDAFIQEYFLNTFVSIENKNISQITAQQKNIFLSVGVLLCFLLYGIIHISKKHKLGYWLIPCFVLFVIGLGRPYHGYYYMITMPFSIFLIIMIFDWLFNKFQILRKYDKALFCIMAIITIVINMNLLSLYRKHKTYVPNARDDYYKAAYIMSQIKNPKVMCFPMSYGIGTPAGSLPACRYWILQAGATNEMIEEREKDLKSGVADFICIPSPSNEKVKEFESYGYVLYGTAPGYFSSKVSLFGRPGLKLPPEDFHVSQWDVWLKRNIFGI